MNGASDWDEQAIARLHRLGGPEFVDKMIDTFLAHTPGRVAALQAGGKSNDLEAVRQAAHSLKSSAANLGARKLRDLCENLEQLAAAKQAESLAALLPELDEVFTQAVASLQARKTGGKQ